MIVSAAPCGIATPAKIAAEREELLHVERVGVREAALTVDELVDEMPELLMATVQRDEDCWCAMRIGSVR